MFTEKLSDHFTRSRSVTRPLPHSHQSVSDRGHDSLELPYTSETTSYKSINEADVLMHRAVQFSAYVALDQAHILLSDNVFRAIQSIFGLIVRAEVVEAQRRAAKAPTSPGSFGATSASLAIMRLNLLLASLLVVLDVLGGRS